VEKPGDKPQLGKFHPVVVIKVGDGKKAGLPKVSYGTGPPSAKENLLVLGKNESSITCGLSIPKGGGESQKKKKEEEERKKGKVGETSRAPVPEPLLK